jgi:hypothetical protein
MTVESLISIREVDSRLTVGLQVRLLWSQVDGRLWVVVLDTRSGETFRVDVRENERPLDVFNHPYAYAADHHIDTCLPDSPVDTPDRHGHVPSRTMSRLEGAGDERSGS